ncbi:MAG: HD-GYP domain-containing protein [Clostridiales bacterium]|jgi:putative nucleotidyltransferase with HDIG domain|nr:HD-GYP domain-containing protein [Clostridiales bacterium]
MTFTKFVPIDEIKVGMVAAMPIFGRVEHESNLILVNEGTFLTSEAIFRLRKHSIEGIHILTDEKPQVAPPRKPAPAPKIYLPPQIKVDMPEMPNVSALIDEKLHDAALAGIHSVFASAEDGGSLITAHQGIRELDNIVDNLIDTLSSDSSGLVHIVNLKSYDDYTYAHSLSVAVISLALGKHLGLDAQTLKSLGMAAILHDIGKIKVSAELINKPGKLTDSEFETIKTHSEVGAAFLEGAEVGDRTLWCAVRSHHEKIDGTGYPRGLKGDNIPLFGRIISVADVYDAITSYRSYRNPMPPSEAFEVLMAGVGTAFDYEIISAFTRAVELYPINSILVLSNKRMGVVIDNVNTLRPVLKMLDNNEILDLHALDNLTLMISQIAER